ncbi:MAG: patatin-like phospholipase family protein [Gammaproteobacteria bacterium]
MSIIAPGPMQGIRPLFILMLMPLAVGCQTPQRWISEQEILDHHAEFLRTYQADLEAMAAANTERITSEYLAARRSPENESQHHDILVLSGGGAFGAFGAGFLEGWGQVTDPGFARPVFDSVSGVSTGALIAPFAFLGTPEAYRDITRLYENPGRDWVRKRGLIPFLPGNVSVFDISKLHARIRSTITPDLIQGLAQGAMEGRPLLVGATNMDYGVMRVWDLAQTALDSPMPDAAEKVVSVLLASSAIPGAFPPILIDDSLYVDGGATMQVVGGLDDRAWLYGHDSAQFSFVGNGPPVKLRVWIIVNQKLLPDPKLVQSRWTSVAARSLSTLIRSSTLQSIQDAETYVRLINRHPEFDAELRYVAIPQDYQAPDSDQMFDANTMRELVRLGREMGANPASWRTEALRPGAPFEVR